MENFYSLFSSQSDETTQHFISSVLLFLILTLFRIIALRGVASLKYSNPELRRRWRVQIKNSITVFFLMGLAIIWASQLQSVAISLVAVAAAIAISFKEFNLCILGGLFKASAQLFVVGDRVEINGIRGDVIDHNFLTTTLLEIGPGLKMHQFTGRRVLLPNSLFLAHHVINETTSSGYGLHSFEFPVTTDADLPAIHDLLLKSAQKVSEPFLTPCRETYRKISKIEGMEEPDVAPRVTKYFPEAGHIVFVVRVPARLKNRGRIEQEILHHLMLELPASKLGGVPSLSS